MSNPVEDRLFALEANVKGLMTMLQELNSMVRILDQYMFLNKQFFDQVKINEHVKQPEVVTPEVVEPPKS